MKKSNKKVMETLKSQDGKVVFQTDKQVHTIYKESLVRIDGTGDCVIGNLNDDTMACVADYTGTPVDLVHNTLLVLKMSVRGPLFCYHPADGAGNPLVTLMRDR